MPHGSELEIWLAGDDTQPTLECLGNSKLFQKIKIKIHNYGACTPAYAGESPWNGGLHRPSQSALSRRVPTKSKRCQGGAFALLSLGNGLRRAPRRQSTPSLHSSQPLAGRNSASHIIQTPLAAWSSRSVEKDISCGFAGQPEHWPDRSGKEINQSAAPHLRACYW